MSRSAAVLELRARISRMKDAGRPVFREIVRLQLLVAAELAQDIAESQRDQALTRRDPSTRQRELELNE